MSHFKPTTEREWQARDAQLAAVDAAFELLVPDNDDVRTFVGWLNLTREATQALLDLIDSHQPNEDDPTSCPHCGMAEEVEHIPGCPCKDRRAL